jgi:uncharacterized protein YggE
MRRLRTSRSSPALGASLVALLAAGAAGLGGACMERPHYAGDLELPGPSAGRTLSVTGTGRVLLAPTHVDFDCVILADADTPAECWLVAGIRTTLLMRALEDEGVPQTDLTPHAASLGPLDGRRRVTQHLRVALDDLSRMPRLLEVAMGPTGGANGVTNVRPGHKDPRAVADRARERALVDAQATAETLAGELSLRVGEVLAVEALPPAGAPAPGEAGSPTELEVVSVLRVTWGLEP